LNGAKPVNGDTGSIVDKNFAPKVELREENGVWRLSMDVDPSWLAAKRPLVTTELLGEAVVPELPFVASDDTHFPHLPLRKYFQFTTHLESIGCELPGLSEI